MAALNFDARLRALRLARSPRPSGALRGLLALRGRLGIGAVAWGLLACSGSGSGDPQEGGDASACPQDLPASCPSKVPSYKADVEPIVQRRCAPCHLNGGVEAATHNFGTYDGIYRDRSDVLSQVYSCRMPQAPAPALSTAERALVLDWLVCHAPNN